MHSQLKITDNGADVKFVVDISIENSFQSATRRWPAQELIIFHSIFNIIIFVEMMKYLMISRDPPRSEPGIKNWVVDQELQLFQITSHRNAIKEVTIQSKTATVLIGVLTEPTKRTRTHMSTTNFLKI